MDHESTRREIVETLARIAIDEVVEGETSTMRRPPGRRPAAELVARSEWFSALADDDKSLVVEAMRQAAYGSLHRMLVAFDGATPIGPGRLRLTWETDEVTVDLTDGQAEVALHDLLSERARPLVGNRAQGPPTAGRQS